MGRPGRHRACEDEAGGGDAGLASLISALATLGPVADNATATATATA
ncbi:MULTISPECIES: hypothetical protein [unclassified Streptomyces]